MSNVNVIICLIGLLVGAYTFIRHLRAFSDGKTPTADAWLVSVGTLGWSVLLYSSLDDKHLTQIELFSRVLLLIYWVGDSLKIQKHCLKLRRKMRQKK